MGEEDGEASSLDQGSDPSVVGTRRHQAGDSGSDEALLQIGQGGTGGKLGVRVLALLEVVRGVLDQEQVDRGLFRYASIVGRLAILLPAAVAGKAREGKGGTMSGATCAALILAAVTAGNVSAAECPVLVTQPEKEAKGKADWKSSYPLSVPVGKGMQEPVYRTLEVLARDGKKLVVHQWAAPTAKLGQPVVLFLHGIGMHGRPYGSVAAAFTSRDIFFLCPDLRGHGQSEGEREVLADPERLRSDLGEVMGLVNKRHPQSPVFIAGESMGGLLAADYAAHGERRLDGLVLLAPAFNLHNSQQPTAIEAIRDLRSRFVKLANEAKLGPGSDKSAGFVKSRLKDKTALSQVSTVSYVGRIASIQAQFPKAADKITVPLFLGLAGKDVIIDDKRAREVFDKAKTPKDHKECRTWDKAFHTVCWDPETEKIMEEVANWVLKRGGGGRKKQP
jgi:alpha-beta hydrolase superfamily lysophospholipase